LLGLNSGREPHRDDAPSGMKELRIKGVSLEGDLEEPERNLSDVHHRLREFLDDPFHMGIAHPPGHIDQARVELLIFFLKMDLQDRVEALELPPDGGGITL